MATLSASSFQILLALSDRERHGYGIMSHVREASAGETRLGPGTLYYSIQRLLKQGHIEEVAERPAPDLDDERRIYYRITASGRAAAEAEARRLERLVELARARALLRDRG